jgi:hypothetical protein
MSNTNDYLKDMEKIRHQYVLDRIQRIKNGIVAAVLGMLAYSANAVSSANNYKTIILLWISCATLLVALYFSGRDAGASLFYNDKSQEGVDKPSRVKMYKCIACSAVLIFIAQSLNSCTNIKNNSPTTRTFSLLR